MQQYYRLGVLDNCSQKWSALYDCLSLKTKRASEIEEPDEATLADLDAELPLGDIVGRIRARNMRNIVQEPEQQATEQPPTTEPEIYYPRPSGDGSSEAGPSQVRAYESGLDAMIDELFSNI